MKVETHYLNAKYGFIYANIRKLKFTLICENLLNEGSNNYMIGKDAIYI